MPEPVLVVKRPSGPVALAGFRVRRILCAELFLDICGLPGQGAAMAAAPCQDRWTDLADSLAALTQPAEFFQIVACRNAGPEKVTQLAFLSVGRGPTEAKAVAACRRTLENLRILLGSALDYAELQPMGDTAQLGELVGHLEDTHVTEVRRKRQRMAVTCGARDRGPIGFRAVAPGERQEGEERCLWHLFPWVPSDDPWRRLLEVLSETPGGAALVVHARGWVKAPAACHAVAVEALAAAEEIAATEVGNPNRFGTILQRQAEALRNEAARRLSILAGAVLAAQVFVTSRRRPPSALLATIEGALDDASIRPLESASEPQFHGGAQLAGADTEAIFAPLDKPTIDLLFGPREASAILRTPMPIDAELAGLPLNRARTAPLLGLSGDDAPIGCNAHRGSNLDVCLDEQMRFRHTYIIGQTGTGKSTLLLHMILHDIRQGRGVAVLDPHGSLINDILLHYPDNRADDLVLVDPTDVERPVGFNVLRIDEDDAFQYQLARDLVVDDLYSYLDRTYDLKVTGGPIFETHFRGMLGLLMGLDPPRPPLVPNLMIFRSLYTNKDLRQSLIDRIRGQDLVLDEFLREVTAIKPGSDISLENIASYITSKFSRFIADRALRNMTCQNATLDLDRIVNERKVLLFDLGKGRFGDQAAGLLASQVISRIRRIVMKRKARSSAPPFYLFADEFQLFADERFAELLAEARKFRLALTIAHQYVQQLPDQILKAVLGNVGTMVTLRVGAVDAANLEGLYSPILHARDLSSLPNFRAYVRSFGRLGQTPFSVEIPPPPADGEHARAEHLRRLSRERFGRARREVEDEINCTYQAYSRFAQGEAPDALDDLLRDSQ